MKHLKIKYDFRNFLIIKVLTIDSGKRKYFNEFLDTNR